MKNSKEKSYMTYPRWHKEKIIELRFPDSYISIKLSPFLYVYSQAHTCTHIHAQTQTHMHTHAHKYSKPCVTTASSWKLKDCRNLHRNKIFSSSVKPQFEAKVSWAERVLKTTEKLCLVQHAAASWRVLSKPQVTQSLVLLREGFCHRRNPLMHLTSLRIILLARTIPSFIEK